MCRYINGGNCECPYTMNSVCDNPSDCENFETDEKGVEYQMKLEEKIKKAVPLKDYFNKNIKAWSNEKELKIAVPQLEKIDQLLLEDLLAYNIVLVKIKTSNMKMKMANMKKEHYSHSKNLNGKLRKGKNRSSHSFPKIFFIHNIEIFKYYL